MLITKFIKFQVTTEEIFTKNIHVFKSLINVKKFHKLFGSLQNEPKTILIQSSLQDLQFDMLQPIANIKISKSDKNEKVEKSPKCLNLKNGTTYGQYSSNPSV